MKSSIHDPLPLAQIIAHSDQNSPERIEVLTMHPVDHRSIKAECRLRIDGLTINGVKIICRALASRPFVAMPSIFRDGEWTPLVTILSPELEAEIASIVLAAWRKGGAR